MDQATLLIHNNHQLSTTTAEATVTLSLCEFRNISLIMNHFMEEIGLMITVLGRWGSSSKLCRKDHPIYL
jgi:hypothetical protein